VRKIPVESSTESLSSVAVDADPNQASLSRGGLC
jgi:hypothetical protein